ncbi:hypothetical protein M758_4G148000 [Ceratodon purpureus]|nr:hypothetical protein M758_4G148000 [Ceratodon purpureus]
MIRQSGFSVLNIRAVGHFRRGAKCQACQKNQGYHDLRNTSRSSGCIELLDSPKELQSEIPSRLEKLDVLLNIWIWTCYLREDKFQDGRLSVCLPLLCSAHSTYTSTE